MTQTHLKIITPQGLFFDGQVDIVTVKTTLGYIGLQHGKSPIIAALDIAELSINSEGTKGFKVCAIAGGVVEATSSTVQIITDAIEYKENIDLKRARRDKQLAEEAIKKKDDEAQMIKAQLTLKKALNRINVREDE